MQFAWNVDSYFLEKNKGKESRLLNVLISEYNVFII